MDFSGQKNVSLKVHCPLPALLVIAVLVINRGEKEEGLIFAEFLLYVLLT